MFFIMGISQKNKKLDFDKVTICKNCGKYGHVNIYMTYSYFMVFFIPIFKWNKRYFATMSCCNSSCEIDFDLANKIEKGQINSINDEDLNFTQNSNVKQCINCGFRTSEDYSFCPKCGSRIA